jgi:hypothetical protein
MNELVMMFDALIFNDCTHGFRGIDFERAKKSMRLPIMMDEEYYDPDQLRKSDSIVMEWEL